MIEVLAQGVRTARKPHRCFHCYRWIEPKAKYGYQTCKYDDVYTLCWHLDCEEMAQEYRDAQYLLYGDECGPLRDDLCESEQYQAELDAFRGLYPHVVCRMELTDQLWRAAQPDPVQPGRRSPMEHERDAD